MILRRIREKNSPFTLQEKSRKDQKQSWVFF